VAHQNHTSTPGELSRFLGDQAKQLAKGDLAIDGRTVREIQEGRPVYHAQYLKDLWNEWVDLGWQNPDFSLTARGAEMFQKMSGAESEFTFRLRNKNPLPAI
jgi:PP-loop superfamily ATP-utilizing enzyme